MQIDLAGIAVSLGAACASGASRISPTLVAMHVAEDRIRSSVRFSLGAETTESEIDETIVRIVKVVKGIVGTQGVKESLGLRSLESLLAHPYNRVGMSCGLVMSRPRGFPEGGAS